MKYEMSIEVRGREQGRNEGREPSERCGRWVGGVTSHCNELKAKYAVNYGDRGSEQYRHYEEEKAI